MEITAEVYGKREEILKRREETKRLTWERRKRYNLEEQWVHLTL
ncbi:MAG: hypothetical protein AB1393_14380 [Candidatus Edwardsbacteria bacterium]